MFQVGLHTLSCLLRRSRHVAGWKKKSHPQEMVIFLRQPTVEENPYGFICFSLDNSEKTSVSRKCPVSSRFRPKLLGIFVGHLADEIPPGGSPRCTRDHPGFSFALTSPNWLQGHDMIMMCHCNWLNHASFKRCLSKLWRFLPKTKQLRQLLNRLRKITSAVLLWLIHIMDMT